MLVLSRKKSEVIVVSGSGPQSVSIRIVVLDIANGQVKLGIDAPSSVSVHRLEVWQRLKSEQSISNIS